MVTMHDDALEVFIESRVLSPCGVALLYSLARDLDDGSSTEQVDLSEARIKWEMILRF